MARCTVARLMRELGLQGARRGKKLRTTARDDSHERASDLLQRAFTAARANQRWGADFTHVATGSTTSASTARSQASRPTRPTTTSTPAPTGGWSQPIESPLIPERFSLGTRPWPGTLGGLHRKSRRRHPRQEPGRPPRSGCCTPSDETGQGEKTAAVAPGGVNGCC